MEYFDFLFSHAGEKDDAKNLPLDKVVRADGSTLAGCGSTEKILDLNWIRSTTWGSKIREAIDPTARWITGWCGWKTPKTRSPDVFCTEYEPDLQELIRMKVLENALWPEGEPPYTWSSFFKVRKGEREVARAIFNLKRRNAEFARPPPFELASIAEVFDVVGRMKYFDVLDFRHYFYQIRLPPGTRDAFRIKTQSKCFRLQVLPMGWSWSPFIGQGITIALLAEAIERAGFSIVTEKDDKVPGKLEFRGKNKNKCRGFVIAWSDNVMIATSETEDRSMITKNLKKVLEECNIEVKRDDPIESGITSSTDGLSFLGLEFRKTEESGLQWRHNEEKKARWLAISEKAISTARDVATVIGCLMWDAVVNGDPPAEHATERALLSRIGKDCVSAKDWNKVLRLNDEAKSSLKQKLRATSEKDWSKRKVSHLPDQMLWLASDASDLKGAAVCLRAMNGVEASGVLESTRYWTPAEQDRSINSREIFAAIEILKIVCLARIEEIKKGATLDPLWVIMAIDNTAAKVSVENCLYLRDLQIFSKFVDLWDLMKDALIVISTVQVGSADQAADEPSREKPIDKDRCDRCRELIARYVEGTRDLQTRLKKM